MGGKFKAFEGRDADIIFQKNLKKHKAAMKKINASIDNSAPAFHLEKRSPRGNNQEKLDAIAHNNLKLANRIFDIMEGPGLISNILKDRENGAGSNHPGTLNFNTRVKEAERIHLQNISMAMRLDNVKPYIHKILPAKVSSSPTNSPRGHSARKTKKNKHGVPGLDFPKGLFNQGNDQNTGKSNASNQSSARINKSKTRIKSSKKSPDKKNSSNVLLEYSKIQNGRVLDVAVIKEPYQDRYAIFGIDIDNGQRYELRLSSDNVSSILDGDILVTSLDNVEVWMALLNKVDLDPVESFSKLSTKHIAPAEPLITSTNATEVNEPVREPEAPAVGRPTTRPGGRGSRAATRPGIETEAARSDNAFEAQEIADVEVPMEVVEVEPIEEVFAEEAEVGEVMESEIEVPKQVEVEEEKEIQEVSVPSKEDDISTPSPVKEDISRPEPVPVAPTEANNSTKRPKSGGFLGMFGKSR